MADVSSNNGTISVANYARAGHVILAIKASQGGSYRNPFHLEQCREAHEFGLTVLHYHFMDPEPGIEIQIANFRDTYLRGWRAGDYASFDMEVPGITTHLANATLDDFHKKTGHEPVLYSDRGFAESNLKGVVIPGKRFWMADWSSNPLVLPKQYILWARQYTNGVVGPDPKFYTGIGKCDGSIVTAGVARALYIRKLRTRKRK